MTTLPQDVTRDTLSDAKRALLEKRLKGARAKPAEARATIPRRREEGPLPLSFSQQRMWFLHELEPTSAAYNLPSSMRLTGMLDVAAMERAINQVLSRHESLRTRFLVVDEEPRQVVVPHEPLTLPIVGLTYVPATEREKEAVRLAIEEARQPFDLTHAPLLRASLLRLSESDHVLLLTVHHIAADGWSLGVLLEEIRTLYNAFTAGEGSPLPELPLQYPDFALWQRQWFQGEVLAQQLAYWKTQLTDQPPLLELPTDRPRPAILDHHGAQLDLIVDPAMVEQLREVARQENVTLFMLLLAAFKVLLARLSQQEDISVGSPIANRTRSELEPLIGLFVNTLVLRSRVSGAMTGRELLRSVRETTLGAYAHQDLPFERLVEELNPERNLSYSPLFQVQFVFQNAPRAGRTFTDLEASHLPSLFSVTKFDLTLRLLEPRDDGMAGWLEYSPELFDTATAHRLIGYFNQVLHGFVSALDQPLALLPLLPERERTQLLDEWNRNEQAYPPACLHERIAAQAARTPDAVALCYEGETLRYRDLDTRANQLAHALRARGIGPESRVALFAERSIELVVGLLGILKAGAAYVPIDPISPPERLAGMLEEAGAALLLTQGELLDDLPTLPLSTLCLDRDWPTIAQQPTHAPESGVQPGNLAYILFTSGSTGRPKGVAVEHRQIVNYLDGILERVAFPAGASHAVVSTFAADLGNTVIFPALCTGGALHIISYERAADPEALADYFSRNRIDCMKIVPSHFEALRSVPNPQRVMPHKRLIFGGEASSWEAIEAIRALRPDATVMNHYGPTETTVGVLTYHVGPERPAYRSATMPLGRPLPNSRMYLLDRNFQPVPVGVPGELYIGGRGVTRGYLGRPALTAERFVPDPFSAEPGARLYCTGDLARYLPDGNIEFLGRGDHQVKIRGYRIELGEIEALLHQHPALREAVVLAREDSPGDKRLVAYVVPQSEAAPALVTELRAFLKQQLPDYMVPAAFVSLDALPLTPNGKLDRRALPAPDASRPDLADSFTAPRTSKEVEVAAIWAEVLGVERVGIDDNFFDLGGESFKAIRVVRRLGPSVSVMALFKQPTVRALAAALSGEGEGSEPDGILFELTKPVPPAERVLTLVCVPYGGAGAISFQTLADALPAGYSLYAVDLPGHDFSRRDEPLQSLEAVAEQCVTEIRQKVSGPIALYGHCVGTALTAELARQLEEAGIELETVYLAGAFPSPRLPGKAFEIFAKLFSRDRMLSDRIYHEFLKSLGGFNEAMEPEELAFVMRNLRHDFNEAERYYTERAATERPKLAAPVVCVVGGEDRATEYFEERVREWEQYAPSVNLAIIREAGHFFLKHQARAISLIIEQQVAALRTPAPEVEAAGVAERPVQPPPTRSREPAPSLRAFFLVAIGQLVSMIGSGLTGFALGVWVFQQTGAVSDFAMISMAALLPGILVLPVAGALVDRVDRRKVMILADLVAGVRTLTLAGLLATNSLELWHVYIAAAVGSMCGAFQRPAYAAAIAQLVPKQYLGHANGLAQMSAATGSSLAPILAGMLIATIELPGVLVLDFTSFLVAITMLLLVRFPNTLFRKREEPLVQEILNGWRYITERAGMVAMVAFFSVTNFLLAILGVLVAPLGLSFGSTEVLGTVLAMGGVGLLAGGLVMSAWGGTARRAEGMILFVLLEGIFMILMGIYPSPLMLAIGLFGFNFCLSISNGHWQALIQSKVEFSLQGRVFSTNQMMAWAAMPLGYLAAGPLADRVFGPLMAQGGALAGTVGLLIGAGPGRGLALMAILIGLLTIVVGALGYRYRRLRFMEDELPDPVGPNPSREMTAEEQVEFRPRRWALPPERSLS